MKLCTDPFTTTVFPLLTVVATLNQAQLAPLFLDREFRAFPRALAGLERGSSPKHDLSWVQLGINRTRGAKAQSARFKVLTPSVEDSSSHKVTKGADTLKPSL